MAMKITFEAQMRGAEEVSRYLSQWEQKLNSTGAAGDKMSKFISDGLGTVTASLNQILKTQGGLDALTKGFGDIGESLRKSLGSTQTILVDNLTGTLRKLKDEIVSASKAAEDATRNLDTAKATGDANLIADASARQAEATVRASTLVNRYADAQAQLPGAPPPGDGSGSGGGGGFSPLNNPLVKSLSAIPAFLTGVEKLTQQIAYHYVESPINAQVLERERVVSGAEAAIKGDITRTALDALKIGFTEDYRQNKMTPENIALLAHKESRRAASVIGAEMIGVGLAGAGVGAVLGGGVGGLPGLTMAGIGAGLFWMGGGAKTDEERIQENYAKANTLDWKKYGFAYKAAGEYEMRLGQNLDGYQRAFGRKTTNRTFEDLQDTFGMTIEELGAGSKHMLAQGKMPTAADAQYMIMQHGLGVSDAWMGQGAMNRPGTSGSRGFYEATKTLLGTAGLGGAEGFTARDPFSQIMAEKSSQYYVSSAEQQQAIMAPLAATVGAISTAGAGQVNPVEAVRAGASMSKMFEDSMRNPMTIEGTNADLWLSKMGIGDPLAQKAFKDANLQNPDTMKALLAAQKSIQTGKPVNINQITDKELAAGNISYASQMKVALDQKKEILSSPWTKTLDPGVRAFLMTKETGGDNFAAGVALHTGFSQLDMAGTLNAGNLTSGPRNIRESQRIDPRTGQRDTSDAALSDYMANKQAVNQDATTARVHDSMEKMLNEVGKSVAETIAAGFLGIGQQLKNEAGKVGMNVDRSPSPINNDTATANNAPPPGSFGGLSESTGGVVSSHPGRRYP